MEENFQKLQEEILANGLNGFQNKKVFPFMSNLWITNNLDLMGDIIVPAFINDTLQLFDTYLSHTSINNTAEMNPFVK